MIVRDSGVQLGVGILDIAEHLPELIALAHVSVADLVNKKESAVIGLVLLGGDLRGSAVFDVPVIAAVGHAGS